MGLAQLGRPQESSLTVLGRPITGTEQASVVVASLQHAGPGTLSRHMLDRVQSGRNVGSSQLGLKRQGGRCDHNDLATLHDPRQHWRQVAEGLASSGSGLDKQMGALLQGVGNSCHHRHLARPFASIDPGDRPLQDPSRKVRHRIRSVPPPSRDGLERAPWCHHRCAPVPQWFLSGGCGP